MTEAENVVSGPVLAEWLGGITQQRIAQLTTKGVVIRKHRGEYLLKESIIAYTKWARDRITGHGTSETGEANDIDGQKLRRLRAQASAEEARTGLLLGKIVEAEAVKKMWEEIAVRIKSKVDSIATKAAPRVAAETEPHKCFSIISTLAREALLEVTGYDAREIASRSGLVKGVAEFAAQKTEEATEE